MDDFIRIRGARQHNLKDVSLDLPRRALTVVTGPSGSGKSSLALDTLFAEGQRRYVESLSTYAKQFLDRMEKPHVESIEGICPAVAIEQKNPTKTSRSTVGTATEVYDYLRLLWARAGRTWCPECGREVVPDTVSGAVDRILELPAGLRFMVTFPLRVSDEVTHRQVVESLVALGFLRVLADGERVDLGGADAGDPEVLGTDLKRVEEILVVVDRLATPPAGDDDARGDLAERLADSVHTAFEEGEGECRVLTVPRGGGPSTGAAGGTDADGQVPGAIPDRLAFTQHHRCPEHPDIRFADPTPQLFSFNNPYGSCPTCTGFGATLEYDLDLIVPNPQRSLEEGAVDPWTKPRYEKERDTLRAWAQDRGVSVYKPWQELPEEFRQGVLHGVPKPKGRAPKHKGFKGIIPFLKSREKKRYKQYIRVFLRQYQSPVTCADCRGARVRSEALWVRVAGRTIGEVVEWPLEELQAWADGLELDEMRAQIAETILREVRARTGFLVEVGLGYLTLSRQTRTLSGGEAQRINLANSLGASLVDTLYVLDEPSVGLHPRDTDALLRLLTKLRDGGNTVVVVEHDPAAIRVADHVVELGPASGEKGGQVVFEGGPAELAEADTVTGRYISGRSPVALPKKRRASPSHWLTLAGARLHNVDRVDLSIPLGAFTVVTGVSGSGKSTLVHDILYRALEQELGGGETSAKEHLGEAVGRYEKLEGVGRLSEAVLVDQTPIGRTPRSNPVTYIKAWDEIRALFADQPLAKQRGYTPGTFSFNTKGGRCEECKGAGQVEIEMVFMADVYVPCEVCRGTRYKPETLEVTVGGLTIAQVLELTVDEAIRFFIRQDKLGQILWHLQQVGLGYLRLGQPAPTLSGGEAQRLKIARELAGVSGKKGRKLYLLDEPTTGLSGEDVKKLLGVLQRLADAGHTVLVIEHNLDLIKCADWIVDMGPDAGHRGGRIVAEGTPEEVAGAPESVTGRYLAETLGVEAGI
jgi:excinuclease ABC subunit A